MLELSHIYKTFNQGTIDEKVLFSDFNITVNDGDFVGVIGSNGSGKTTMLNVISGDMPIDSGSVLLDGKELNKLKNFKRAQRIGRVFQNPAMGTCPSMTIWENLSIADNKGKNFGLSFDSTVREKTFTVHSLNFWVWDLKTDFQPLQAHFRVVKDRRLHLLWRL